MSGTPVTFILYDKGPDPGDGTTYSKSYIPVELLLRAKHIGEALEGISKDEGQPAPEQPLGWFERFRRWQHRNDPPLDDERKKFELLAQFVADVFDNQFTAKDAMTRADYSELMAVLVNIIARTQVMPKNFPTIPQPRPKKGQR